MVCMFFIHSYTTFLANTCEFPYDFASMTIAQGTWYLKYFRHQDQGIAGFASILHHGQDGEHMWSFKPYVLWYS